MAQNCPESSVIPLRPAAQDGGGPAASIAELTSLLEQAEAMSDSLGLSMPSAFIGRARDALRRSTS